MVRLTSFKNARKRYLANQHRDLSGLANISLFDNASSDSTTNFKNKSKIDLDSRNVKYLTKNFRTLPGVKFTCKFCSNRTC